jgi:hypothetical protein
MEWLKDYWWLILLFLLGVFLNVIRDLNSISYKHYLDKKKGPQQDKVDEKEDNK